MNRGAIDGTLVIVIGLFLGLGLMFVFPMMAQTQQVDVMAQSVVQTATTELVREAMTTGKLTTERYDSFIQELSSTGYNFDVEIQVKTQDSNLGKKVTQAMSTYIGETVGHTNYTSQMEEELNTNGEYIFKEGDMFSVKVKNRSTTLSQQFSKGSEDIYVISAEDSGMITTNGN